MKRARLVVLCSLALLSALAGMDLRAQAPSGHVRAAIDALLEKDGYGRRREAILSRISPSSVETNRRGYQAYSEKRYGEAEKLFRRALDDDADNSLAAYNLACTLSLMGKGGAGLKEIVRLLWRAAESDFHWALKLFSDPDLDGARGQFFSHSAMLPCPGDCGPDQWYEFRADGSLGYGAGDTDLSGMAASEPRYETEGYYAAFGSYVFAYLPERPAILSGWPTAYPEEPEAKAGPDMAPGEAFVVFQIRRGVQAGTVTRVSAQTDLWD